MGQSVCEACYAPLSEVAYHDQGDHELGNRSKPAAKNKIEKPTLVPSVTIITSSAKSKPPASWLIRWLRQIVVRLGQLGEVPKPTTVIVPTAHYDSTPSLTAQSYVVQIPLNPEFRFAHEPVGLQSTTTFVGRQRELDALSKRILFSNGGSFLVTGYRGVGKTSFVNQVLHNIKSNLAWAEQHLGKTEILDVHLNIARPMQPAELMHHIIRRLYGKLIEHGIYEALNTQLQEELSLAHQRTSVNMTRTLSQSIESGFGIDEISLSAGALKAKLKPGFNTKLNRGRDVEMSFLGYDDKAAEYDIISLSRKLAAGYYRKSSFGLLADLKGLFSRRTREKNHVKLKIIFVFDEMDKLDEFTITKSSEDSEQIQQVHVLDDMLGALKNLFTTSGISFIFVAGRDLHERWREDLDKGDSIYESVFSYDKYLPCLWADIDQICNGFVDWSRLGTDRANRCYQCGETLTIYANFCPQCGATSPDSLYMRSVFNDFRQYLSYRGRGIPRRVIRSFNEFVQWLGGRPVLAFTRQDVRRIRFYAGLQSMLVDSREQLTHQRWDEASGSRQDKHLLGIYYLVDWMLKRGQSPFSLSHTVRASRQLSVKIAFAQEVAPELISNILTVLTRYEYLEEVAPELDQVQVVDTAAEPEKRYKIAARRWAEMTDDTEQEAATLTETVPVSSPSGQYLGQYRLIQPPIGKGGLATVYRGWDEKTERFVAIKVLDDSLVNDPQMVNRFKREATVLQQLVHTNIVRYYDHGNVGQQFYIAMEYVDGPSLEKIIEVNGRLPYRFVNAIFQPILSALEYYHQQGFVRSDVKPGNIVLSLLGKVFLLDFGITRPQERQQRQGMDTIIPVPIGTPQYMAPEQWGDHPTEDSRSDIYAVGVALYETLSGKRPFDGSSVQEIMMGHLSKSPPPLRLQVEDIPMGLEATVMRCLEKEPSYRHSTMAELSIALSQALENTQPSISDSDIDLAALAVTTQQQAVEQTRLTQGQTIIGVGLPVPPPPPISSVPPPPSLQKTASAILTSEPVANPATLVPRGEELVPNTHIDPELASLTSLSGSPPEAKAWLVFSLPLSEPADTQDSRQFFLHQARYRIGRSSESDLVLDGVGVSRFHAQIYDEADCYYIEDLNSGNGTYVNGQLLHQHHALQNNDLIKIGSYDIHFYQPVAE